jgi:hypothetical protein
MTLEWIEHPGRDKDGDPFLYYLLVDQISSRLMGTVDAPLLPNRFCYWAEPEEGKDRRYMTLEAAKAYVEFCAVKEDQADYTDLEKIVPQTDKAQPTDQSVAVPQPE